jgi:hypothetical protein
MNSIKLKSSVPSFLVAALTLLIAPSQVSAGSTDQLPIADAHVHYSHDSVELTPPERVIELMRSANLKFALVSSSDDNGTQLLSALAPDLIIPGLRPYRRRGELSSWFTDQGALAYVEDLLAKNRYATIGEFHLFGDTVELPIPRRMVELADEYNLVLHAHSDAEAVERLLAQSDTVKIIWAHSGFEGPADVADMLRKHDRLWADLAFRGEVGSGGQLSEGWQALFKEFPDRMMLGTDTYTPERMYYIPEHADGARVWLASLPFDVAERVAWKNAHDLLMPIWQANRTAAAPSACVTSNTNQLLLEGDMFDALITPKDSIAVSQPFAATVQLCGEQLDEPELLVDVTMPAHGHGMNYKPVVTLVDSSKSAAKYNIDGLVLHMPGQWEWSVSVKTNGQQETLKQLYNLK